MESVNRILIVDDNDFNSFSLQELIHQNYNMRADIAVHGLDALEKVRLRHEASIYHSRSQNSEG